MEISEQTAAPEPKMRFFLGANTPSGFVSRFDQLADAGDGWRLFVIKGGPGTGKSSLIRRAAAELERSGVAAEYIHCSSDADSLDGAIFPAIKCAVADGTPPHAIEPKYPGAFESVVTLNDCWDESLLRSRRGEITALFSEISACHRRCCRCLSAAAMLGGEIYQTAADLTDVGKIERCAKGVASRELKRRGLPAAGREKLRFISAVTNKGRLFFNETAAALCRRIYIVEDEWGVSSRLLLARLRAHALSAGFDVISCHCPLAPQDKLEHLIIPELELGFFTQSRRHRLDPAAMQGVSAQVVHAGRFTDVETLRRKRRRLSFAAKMEERFLCEAEEQLAVAKKLHDELESHYIAATDFDEVRFKGEKLTEKLKEAL